MKKLTSGFTLLETLLVLAVAGILITIVTLSFGGVNASQALNKSAKNVVSVLDEARTKTFSSSDDSRYGVRLEDSRVILFRGSSYVSTDPENEISELHALVGIRNISIAGGGASVVFDRLTGATSQFGTFEIYLKNATATYRTISIARTGVVEEN
jgi:prepilin-type N-terminal cleavage/methylation domain-containing protein